MQVMGIQSSNNNPAFNATLKIEDANRILSRVNREFLQERASKVGTK